jgi:hypothetical protein
MCVRACDPRVCGGQPRGSKPARNYRMSDTVARAFHYLDRSLDAIAGRDAVRQVPIKVARCGKKNCDSVLRARRKALEA